MALLRSALSVMSLVLLRSSPTRRLRAVTCSESRAEWTLQRELSDALAGGCEDRVGQRRPRDRSTRLADPAGRLEVSHQVHFDRGRFVHPQDPVIVEIGLLDPAILECDLAPQRAADAEIDAALDLCLHGVRVHHGAAVERDD